VGTYRDAEGGPQPYGAGDQRLLAWVHAAFTDSFLTTHEIFGAPIPGGPDAYVGAWVRAGELVGLTSPPRTAAELREQITGFGPELAYTEATARTLAFLRRPPLPAPARAGYAVLFAAAASTLRPEHRELLRLPNPGTRIPRAAASALLAALRVVLCDGPPAARAARRRLHRLDDAA
jgi:uncharacterized protein (DUF2236 family)